MNGHRRRWTWPAANRDKVQPAAPTERTHKRQYGDPEAEFLADWVHRHDTGSLSVGAVIGDPDVDRILERAS